MNKSRILGIALSAALVASMAAVSTFSASAAVGSVTKSSDVKSHKVGITGSFNQWASDVAMTDDDGDGVWEGKIEIASVTDEMLQKDKDKKNVKGKDGSPTIIQFKVRLDSSWDNSWGTYEPDYDRTNNSQTNCEVAATVGQPLTVDVKLDTTKADPAAVKADGDIAETDLWNYWPVTYTVEKTSTEASKSTESSKSTEASKSTDTSKPAAGGTTTDTSKDAGTSTDTSTATETSDSKTVPTGDTTSAVALVAVVLASLGTAVVMTKKASSK